MRFEFDWDPAKAANNLAKHRVSFEEAMAIFHDPLAAVTAGRRSGRERGKVGYTRLKQVDSVPIRLTQTPTI